jgi:hypothetical protein
MQMVIEMPDELKGVGEAVKAMIRQVEANWRSTRGGRAVDYAAIERQVAAGVAAPPPSLALPGSVCGPNPLAVRRPG